MNKFVTWLFFIVCISGQASAGCPDGFYASLMGGGNFIQTDEFDSVFGVNADPGFIAGGALGYKMYGPACFEVEVAYRRNYFHTDRVIGGEKVFNSTGIGLLTVMGNLLFEFNYEGPIVPYIGIGVGYTSRFGSLEISSKKALEDLAAAEERIARKRAEAQNLPADKIETAVAITREDILQSAEDGAMNDTGSSAAYQFIAGVGYQFSSAMNLAIEYHFAAVAIDLKNHSVLMKLRQSF